ncbi:MAG: tRNA 2-selenouridine(34) synthase MnmH [Spirulina sp. SIO3F2]|nr:tRNA 2-selenouridine(34) synthase MnmH [Spirulina sp. SIO3F2]
MVRTPQTTATPWLETYSEIIDVRSPAEYALDHLPGAINLPVLDNEQRAEVGTMYTQVSPFQARKLGAAYVSANISQHLASHFAHKDLDYAPLIYCWRGGQRSRSLSIILTQIGWSATLLDGGYKTYRTHVREQLGTLPGQLNFRVLCGMTGTGKTQILQQLAQTGMQILDLEGLANHRGSLLGQAWLDAPEPQPSQKYFETLVLQQLQTFDPRRPIWVESESSKIGKVYLPVQLWHQLKASPGIELQIPIAARVHGLLQGYPHLIAHPDFLKEKLQRLQGRYRRETLAQWFAWIDAGDWATFVESLLETHYDPAYRRSLQRDFPQVTQTLTLASLEPSEIERAIGQLQQYPTLGA